MIRIEPQETWGAVCVGSEGMVNGCRSTANFLLRLSLLSCSMFNRMGLPFMLMDVVFQSDMLTVMSLPYAPVNVCAEQMFQQGVLFHHICDMFMPPWHTCW